MAEHPAPGKSKNPIRGTSNGKQCRYEHVGVENHSKRPCHGIAHDTIKETYRRRSFHRIPYSLIRGASYVTPARTISAYSESQPFRKNWESSAPSARPTPTIPTLRLL